MKSIEMGQAVPEHFFEQPQKVKSPSSSLKKGVICLAVGLALMFCFSIIHNSGFLIGGVIPAFIGIGFLVVYFVEKPKTNLDKTDEQHG